MAHEELSPLNITPGAIRFNTDSMKLEYFRIGSEGRGTGSHAGIGSLAAGEWVQLTTDSPEQNTGSARGVFMGGQNEPSPNAQYDIMDYVQIDTTGNAIDFGDLVEANESEGGALGGHVRGYYFGGDPAETGIETFVFSNVASGGGGGDSTVYGTLTANSKTGSGTGNRTRGIAFLGNGGNVINYFALAATGSGVDFGDATTNAKSLAAACGSPTRGIIGGGSSGEDAMGYITISTLGNTASFGDLSTGRAGLSAGSNAVRGLFAGGVTPTDGTNSIEYVTIATLGNGTEFGDLTRRNHYGAAVTSLTRFVYGGGDDHPNGGNYSNIIDYVQIMTLGNALDFGDLTQFRRHLKACSNGNGGVG